MINKTKEPAGIILFNENGVTLMEAMIYLAMAGMLLATAVTAFLGQNKSYNRQDVVAEIQQNVRGVGEMLLSDIRLAGIGNNDEPEIPFELASHGEIVVNYWEEDENGVNRIVSIRYYLIGTDLTREIFIGGFDPDNPATNLQSSAVVAENIEDIRFNYLFDNDPSENELWQWRVSANDIFTNNDLAAEEPEKLEEAFELIRAVKIVFLGGSRPSSFSPTDSVTYDPDMIVDDIAGRDPLKPPWIPEEGTGYKRMVSMIAQCRNNLE